MPFNIERLDNSTPRDFSAKQINHSFRAYMLRFTLVHRLDCFSQFVDARAHASIIVTKIADCPESVRDASGHRWRATNRNVGLHEIVIGVVQSDRRFEVFQFLGKRIGQSREATAVHPQCVILFFNVTRGKQINNRIPRNRNPLNIHHLWRRISALFLKITVAKGFDD